MEATLFMTALHHRIAALLLALGLAFGAWLGASALVQAQPRQFRTKIDKVLTQDAPELRLLVTFLDEKDTPVNPEHIDLSEVVINDRTTESREVQRGVWAQQPEGTDLVLILPATRRLGPSAFKILQETVPELIKGMGEQDRIALITYSRSVGEDVPLAREKDKVAASYGALKRSGVRPFMFSALDKGITMLQPSPEGRKKAIIYVGDGTDAATIKVEDLNEKLKELITRAEKSDIQVWCVGYATGGLNPSDTRTMRLLSRKTNATYREAPGQRQLREALDQTMGEIAGQLVLTLKADVKEQQTYEFKVRLQSEHGSEIESLPYTAKVNKVATDWVLIGIVAAVCCLVGGLTLIILVIVLYRVNKSRARREAEELLADLLADREEKCDTCHRVMKPEWEECFFCAQGMEPLKHEEREPPFVYDEQDRRLCNVCGRSVPEEWQACAFCAQHQPPLPEWRKKKDKEAMLLGRVDPDKLTEQMLKQQAEEQAAIEAAQAAAMQDMEKRAAATAAGGRECSTCGRMMPAHWPECLHCAAGLPPIT